MVVTSLALSLALGAVSVLAAAPNLVPNPSFELFSQCPDDIDTSTGQIHFATSWSRAYSTPDYFNSCGVFPSVETPANQFGSQCPIGGLCGPEYPGAYGGMVAHMVVSDTHELIQTPLSSSLLAGKTYRVRFYVSLADFSNYAEDRMGAHLRIGAVNPANPPVMVPQVENLAGHVLENKLNWMLISGKFTASGGEDRLVLGNFSAGEDMVVRYVGGGTFDHAYYYIEQVSVRRADITEIAILPPGGGGDVWEVHLTSAPSNSPAWLYSSNSLDGCEINGHDFDLGGTPFELAQATTDASGTATFRWSLSAAIACCANRDGTFYLEARVDDPGSGETSDSDDEMVHATPTDVSTSPAASGSRLGRVCAGPNPFNPVTEISYELLRDGPARIELFDARGRFVRRLAEHGWQSAGRHALIWNGLDQQARPLGAGVYYFRVSTFGESRASAVVLVK